jgi:hypothetical protein
MTTSVDPGAVHKNNLTIALGTIAGVFAVLLIFSIIYNLRQRRRNLTARTIDGSPSDGNSVTSNNRSRRGYSQSGDSYLLVEPYQHSIEQTTDGKWRDFQYDFVENMAPPEMSPPHPAQQIHYTPPQNHYDHGSSQYGPGYIITGSSSPPMMGLHSPLLMNSSTISVNMLTSLSTEDLSGYYVAPASEYAAQKQPLVVVGGPVDEGESHEGIQTGMLSTQPLSLTDESLTILNSC